MKETVCKLGGDEGKGNGFHISSRKGLGEVVTGSKARHFSLEKKGEEPGKFPMSHMTAYLLR
jgi:hypothetical protein